MAGNYPDVPAPRMAYDRDGSILLRINKTTFQVLEQYGQNALDDANNEEMEGSGNPLNYGPNQGGRSLALILPELRNLVGYNFGSWAGIANLEWSDDTTNGVDGIWNLITATPSSSASSGSNKVYMRNSIQTVSFSGVRGLRWDLRASSGSNHSNLGWLHLYGNIATGENLDRLRVWHPTLNEPLDDNTSADGAHLDWGDVPRGTTADKTFRIKNNSDAGSNLTAQSIDISTQVLTDASPAIGPQITYSNGGAFASSINIGDLTPGQLSSVITVRRNTPSNASLSLWTWRTVAEPGSWV